MNTNHHSFHNKITRRAAALLAALAMLLPLCTHAQDWSGRTPRYEVRGVWLTTLGGLDWPRRAATTAEGFERQKKELCSTLDQLKAAGINTVFFQARIRSTTAYPSAIEPWDGVFTGTPGRAPDYDPLRLAVDECHKRGMELHAWVVAFPICKVAVAKKLGRKALPSLRPELCKRAGDQWMMNPGVPETATYLASICKEIAENYDVDGIHLDYIRYPEESIPWNDKATFRRYGKKGQSLAEWRTENVTRCVRAIHDAVKAVRPWIKMSCSPVGKHSDLPRQSSYGWNAREAVNQDAQEWLRQGLMDMLCPMMYFDGKHFYPFALDWKEGSAGRPVVPGLGIYFLSPNEKDWDLDVIRRQIYFIRQAELGGEAYFRSKFLTDNVKGLYSCLQTEMYRQPSLIPPMTWADSVAPSAPQGAQAVRQGFTLRMSWQAVADATPVTYRIYRLDRACDSPVQDSAAADGEKNLQQEASSELSQGKEKLSQGKFELSRGKFFPCKGKAKLVADRLKSTQCNLTPPLASLLHCPYFVVAVDAYGNESPASLLYDGSSAENGGKEGAGYVVTTGQLALPADAPESEYLLVCDLSGRHVMTLRRTATADLSALTPGGYELRTLARKGISHRLMLIWKTQDGTAQ